MKRLILLSFINIISIVNLYAQPCSTVQSLNGTQQTQLSAIVSPLDTALKYEDLFHIDSLSFVMKNIYGAQGGIPDAIENGQTLLPQTNWLDLPNSLTLSRLLIGADSLVYVDLWKTAKGMKPPSYQPHSLFLRAGAEIAVALLKIADKETDLNRKNLYTAWATRALDSLATMQLPNGAFPFPDLRDYGDATFSSIIQNFMIFCGPDSVNVLQNGWIVDDKGLGEFKFDAGVIANAYYEAFNYTGILNYKNIAISIGDYLLPLKFNRNYNYNTFASLGLTRAYQLTNDMNYLNRAITTLRYSVKPGQLANGRWVDGHNANSRYHSIIIQNMVPTINLIPSGHVYEGALDSMAYLATKNMVDYTMNCGAATGFRWLMKAYQLEPAVIPNTLKDSISNLIGRHINEAAFSYSFLDMPSMGDYLELLDLYSGITDAYVPIGEKAILFPNPTDGISNLMFQLEKESELNVSVFDTQGNQLFVLDNGIKKIGSYAYTIDLTTFASGTYYLVVKLDSKKYTKKIIKQ